MLSANLLAGTPLTLGAAAAFGASSVLQFRASHQTPEQPAGRPSLLLHLVRQREWRLSVVLAAGAFGLQVAALSLMPLILVQPAAGHRAALVHPPARPHRPQASGPQDPA